MDADVLNNFQLDMDAASEVGMIAVLSIMVFVVALGTVNTLSRMMKSQPPIQAGLSEVR